MIDTLSQQIIDLYYADYPFFFSKPNVTGIAYGYKVTNGIETLEPSIHVFVEKKVSPNSLSKYGIIPPLYKGIKTDVIETGKFLSSNDPQLANKDSSNNIRNNILETNKGYTGKVRPIQPGWSMSTYSESNSETGTLGYIVTDNMKVSKTYCLLSVNKTFANYNKRKIGDVVIQPAKDYGGIAPNDMVGNLLRFCPLKFKTVDTPPPPLSEMNQIDASVATFHNNNSINLINPFIPPKNIIPTGIISPDIGKQIQWSGCFSGYQTGTIKSISAIVQISYSSKLVFWFKDVTITTGFVFFQDQGALVVDDKRKALGLLFAYGNFFGNLVCRIKDIEKILNVKLLTL